MIELKPCPFCGGRARLYYDDMRYFVVHQCNGGGSLFTSIRTDFWRTPEEAVKAWNTREAGD